MKTMTTSDVKQKNKENVINYIYHQQTTSQQIIGNTLHLSRPTVIQILKECEDERIIEKNGFYESTGGRKANAIHFRPDARVAVGVELLADAYEIVVVNLYGETLHFNRTESEFRNHADYYRSVCNSVNDLIAAQAIPAQNILGIGIVLQGLISSDGAQVTYGKILDCTGLTIDTFAQHLPYPCKLFHDAESAARDELWQSPKLKNAIYVNIRSNLSGAIIVDKDFLKGTELKSGVFEHMTIVPGGHFCYCGHRGCFDTYCSTRALLNSGETLDEFFTQLRNANHRCRERWLEYLKYLAVAINNLHMFIDYPVILGGTISKYLTKDDLSLLHQLVHDNTAFPSSHEFIRPSCCPDSPISRGAALAYINKYLRVLISDF